MNLLVTPVLAEVSDKMNSWPTLTAWIIGISVASAVSIRKRRWIAIVPGLFALLWSWGAYDLLSDRFMKEAVIVELGLSYILIQFIPLTVFLTFLLIEMKRPNQPPETRPTSRPVSA